VTIFIPGFRKSDGHLHRRGQHAAGVVAQFDHQPGQTVASQLLDGRFHFLRGLLVEAVDADITDAGTDEEGASTLGDCSSSGVKVKCRRLGIAGRRTSRRAWRWRDCSRSWGS
jgi:hypothetical protein